MGHPRRTEHWALAVPISHSIAHVFQLEGNYDTFHYTSARVDRFSESSSMRGGIQIGEIQTGAVSWLGERLKDVRVITCNPDFDCQNWVLDAVRLLRDTGGIIYPGITEQFVRYELYREKERWEIAEDTIIERLFP